MKHTVFSAEQDGFCGVWYPAPKPSSAAVLAMAGDSCTDYLARTCAKWLHGFSVNVMALSPSMKDYSHHNLPLERFSAAITWLKSHGINKIGIMGMSTTGMLALLVSSLHPEITLTVALSPSDFVMEGFYQENGIERPGNGESTVSLGGEPLPYLPYAYRHPEYWQKITEESKRGHNRIASRELFDRSEELHPVTERERIRVENIRGTAVLIGAEDDCLWDTCKYIRRMKAVREQNRSGDNFRCLTFAHGTHFVFPESLLRKILPLGGASLVKFMFQAARDFPKECRETRMEIDRQLREVLTHWAET